MEQTFRRGLAVFRWGAWVWIAVTLGIYWPTSYLRHEWLALALVALALAFTVAQTGLVRGVHKKLSTRAVSVGELATGFTMMVLDGYVRRTDIVFQNGATLGSWWPVVALLSASTLLSFWGAALSGMGYGVARFFSTWLNGVGPSSLTAGEVLSIVDTSVFSALAAISVVGLMKLLHKAEVEISLSRAREEIAAALHDGVLQTLAVVERRSDDEALVRLAGEQERELRRFLFEREVLNAETEELGAGLMKCASLFERRFDGTVNVVLAPDLPLVAPSTSDAVIGAVGEALTNAGKHGNAAAITVYVEPDGAGLFCSVKDNGSGFDPVIAAERVGLSHSIKGRVEEVGGRVEVKSVLNEGTEVLMWLP